MNSYGMNDSLMGIMFDYGLERINRQYDQYLIFISFQRSLLFLVVAFFCFGVQPEELLRESLDVHNFLKLEV
jgi:hypothetical protein